MLRNPIDRCSGLRKSYVAILKGCASNNLGPRRARFYRDFYSFTVSYTRMKFLDAAKQTAAMLGSAEFHKTQMSEDPRMIVQLPILQKINQHRFLTTESQSGVYRRGTSVHDGTPYEMSERAFLSGFMLEADAIKFLKLFNLTDKNATYIPFCSEEVRLPVSLDMPVTITKQGKKTEVTTHTPLTYPKSHWEFLRKNAHINKSEPVVAIYCWDSHWNRLASGKSGLFTEVLDVLKKM